MPTTIYRYFVTPARKAIGLLCTIAERATGPLGIQRQKSEAANTADSKPPKAESAVCALIAGSPTLGFLGFAILDPLYGSGVETGLVVAIVAMPINAITLPLGLFPLSAGKTEGGLKSQSAALLSAIKQPVVWAPILGVIRMLLDSSVPVQFDPSFKLVARANSSVAVFAAGLTLSAYNIEIDNEVAYNVFYKLVLMPGVFLIAGWACGLSSEIRQMRVLCVALPPGFS